MTIRKPSSRRVAFDAVEGSAAAELYGDIRREVFGEDLGQNSWLTAREQDGFVARLGLGVGQRVLDVASGSGEPALRLARRAGCEVLGIEVLERRVRKANDAARAAGLAEEVRFERRDASRPLPYARESFDAVVCVDSISLLPNRRSVFAEWSRLIKPGAHVVFTDAAVKTGPLSDHELAIRGAVANFTFVQPGHNERLLGHADLELVACEDTTATLAAVAERWRRARAVRASRLRAIEGEGRFEVQQEFFAVTACAARERRLCRFVYVARKPRAPTC